MHLHCDFETASKVNLKKAGVDRYARHKSTRVLMLAYAANDHTPHVWLPHIDPVMPAALRRMLDDPTVEIVAHNAAFERAIFLHVLGIDIPLERFTCTQAMAFSLALPGDLDQLTRDALKLSSAMQKDKEGKALIKLFCEPNKKKPTKKNPNPPAWNDWATHPAEWARFVAYCLQDVVAERKVHDILSKYITDMPEMRRLWVLCQRINERGVPVDMGVVRGAQIVADKTKAVLLEQMTELSGLHNPNSAVQALEWLTARGYPYGNLRKERVAMALEFKADEMTEDCIKFLKMRQQAAKTSVTKLQAIERAVSHDQRLRNMFQFRAAGRTGRYGGRTVQLQNLARPHPEVKDFLAEAREILRDADYEMCAAIFTSPLDIVSSSIRSVLCAEPGHKLVVADLSAIELAVLAWLTGSKFWLDVLRDKRDPYKSFGVHFLNKPYDEITKKERNECKPGALGSGYRLGGGFLREDENGDLVKTGLWGYAESLGVKLTQEQAALATSVYRDLSPEIVSFWYELENAVMDCIRDQQPRRVKGLVIDIKAPFLRIRLPSGRRLHYCRPKIQTRRVLGGMNEDRTPKYFNATNMTYEGVGDNKKWVRQATHGGKLTENVVQAIALDILNYGMEQAEAKGFYIILHVHDEVGAMRNDQDSAHTLLELIRCMTAIPPWGEGLPLGAAGYESDFYKKD
jgi:DNA polymerase